MSYNSISQLPSELNKLKKLHTLIIDQNKFSKFPNVLYKMNNLKKIRIYGNEIENIKTELNN